MKTRVSSIVLLAAGCLCLPVMATVAAARDAKLGVPPEHEMWQRPIELCRGVKLRAYALDEPRLMKAYVAHVDLGEPGLGFTATDRDEKWGEPMPDYTNRIVRIHTKRETTPGFMMRRREAGEPVVLAVNASPWVPWDCSAAYHSKYGAFRGWNVSHGVELSRSKKPRTGPLFVVYKDGRADVVTSVAKNRAREVAFAFSGFGLIMTNGVPTAYARQLDKGLAPRTVFGLDASRRKLVLLVVDGRQPNYSVGAFGTDLYEILRKEGVTDAVNMDGGGSSTLSVFDEKSGKPWTLNRSSDGRPRRNALNVGIVLKDDMPQPVANVDGKGKPLKVLMIGNSFSICNLKQMPQVAASMGLKLDLASLYIGGCSLERHWNNVMAASTKTAFRPYRFDRTTDGTKVVVKGSANIPDALVLDKWDVVTIQQASHFSWQPATYNPFGDSLIAKIRELAPQARIVVQETWSYPPWDKRLKKFGFDQAEMYKRLHGAYASFAAKHGLDVIPVGTAAEFVSNRNALFTKPDFHFNREGEYLQGLAFTAKLFGVDARKCPYHPSWMNAARADEIKAAVMDAVAPGGQQQREMSVSVGDARVGFSLGTVSYAQMKSLSVTTNGNIVTATWKGHPECGEEFTVTAKMRMIDVARPTELTGGGRASTRAVGFEYIGFEYSGNEMGRRIQRISFPEITVPRTDKTAIFRPNTVGEVFRPDWKKFGSGKDVSTSGANWLTFSCIAALNDGGTSHFLDQRGEARLHTTSFAVTQGSAPDTLVLRNVYVPPMTDERMASGSLPYSGVYAPFAGGWYEAAKMHRAWLETTPWFKKAAARDFSKLREIALWMWSRGGVEVSEPPVHWFMKETGLKVALDWYWWHGIPYDTSFPYFWPPRDGVDGFRDAVMRMKARGAFVQVYTNGASWDCDDPRWADGGLDSAIMTPKGGLFAKMYNVFTRHRLARMCGEAPKFQAIIRQLERNLRESGLDGVYMDQISCGAHSACYNPRHSHAPGGDAVEKGYREYVQAVRDDNPGFILSSEATSETYFDLFEAGILLYSSWERCGKGLLPQSEPVPAVSVIYRGAEVVFGSFATPGGAPAWDPMWGEKPDGDEVEAVVAKYPDQFAVELARGIVWGIQPMVHNFTMKDVANPRLAKDLQFMKDSARFYYDNRDFLFDGEMLKPAKLRCATKRVEFLSASCYKRVKDSTTYVQKALPCVFHSEWRAKDGRRAAVLVNWTREEQSYELESDGVKRSGTLPALSWSMAAF